MQDAKLTIKQLKRFAKAYNVDKNQMINLLIDQYAGQLADLAHLREVLKDDGIVVTKVYVKGRHNVYVHPLLKELTKQIDCCNKSADLIMKMVMQFGTEPEKETKLVGFM